MVKTQNWNSRKEIKKVRYLFFVNITIYRRISYTILCYCIQGRKDLHFEAWSSHTQSNGQVKDLYKESKNDEDAANHSISLNKK